MMVPMRAPSPILLLLLLLRLLPSSARADCECGYTVQDDAGGAPHLFTSLLETDFARRDVTTTDAAAGGRRDGWAAQQFAMSREAARGPYGEAFVPANVVADPDPAGAGLRLVVGAGAPDGSVRSAEVATTVQQYYHGSFRAGIRVTDVPGTCSAFFWYLNDTQEIDMEFLSSQFDRSAQYYPVNLVLQSAAAQAAAAAAGHESASSSSNTSSSGFATVPLPFDPTAAVHEYRFDFLLSSSSSPRVAFYADGARLAVLTGDGVPSAAAAPGNLLLSHWSNGNPLWSAGPPARDAVTTVRYVKAYFNASGGTESGGGGGGGGGMPGPCAEPRRVGAVCAVPEFDPAFFFTDQGNRSSPGDGAGGGDEGGGAGGGDGGGDDDDKDNAGVRMIRWSAMALPVVLTVSIWSLS